MQTTIWNYKEAITCNSLNAREKSRVHGAIGFGFASHWLKNWRESFKPLAKRSAAITFDNNLTTALNSYNDIYTKIFAAFVSIGNLEKIRAPDGI